MRNAELGAAGGAPLIGLRVLDLSRLLPGGFCTKLLGDLGAEIVKLEDTQGGDYLRWISGDILFPALNRGKRSLALDLRNQAGREAFLRLLPGFDVLLESFRPGVLARLGCGYEQARARHPGLIYCALSGYGQSGERAGRSGHDINYVSTAGLLSGCERPMPAPVADFCGGYAAALAIVAALEGRRLSGQGCFLDISLTEAVRPLALTRLAGTQLEGTLACYSLYRTADGKQVSLGALEPKFFAAFTAAVGRAELAGWQFDEARQEELKTALSGIFAGRTRDEWEKFFTQADACGAAVLTPREAFAGQDLAGPVPAQGQHTTEILAQAGFTAQELADLRAAGAIPGDRA